MESKSHTGLLAGLALIVILTLVFFYLYGADIAQETTVPLNNNAADTEPADSIADIEADLESFDVESLDTTDPEIESTLELEIDS